jgi:NADPH:quinone reductase-like Zn-dependent oxidoreductase
MKALIYHAHNDIHLEEQPIPTISDQELLVQVHGCGLCGSDIIKIVQQAAPPVVPGVLGQQVTSATTVAEITDLQSVKITAYVDESAIKNIAEGQAVDIHVDAYNSTIPGHVTQVIGAAASQFSLLPITDNSSSNYTKVSHSASLSASTLITHLMGCCSLA